MSTAPSLRARQRLRKELETLQCRLLRAQLFMSAWWHGGSLVAGPRLCVQHKSVFQGYGRLCIGADVTFGYTLAGFLGTPIIMQPRTERAEIVIGDGSTIVNGCFFSACESIHIGANCRIGSGCIVVDSDYHGVGPHERDSPGKTFPVQVGDNVWLGISVTVLKGVRIGKDVVAGAQTVIAKDVPDGAIVVGNPMRVIGSVHDPAR